MASASAFIRNGQIRPAFSAFAGALHNGFLFLNSLSQGMIRIHNGKLVVKPETKERISSLTETLPEKVGFIKWGSLFELFGELVTTEDILYWVRLLPVTIGALIAGFMKLLQRYVIRGWSEKVTDESGETVAHQQVTIGTKEQMGKSGQ